MNSVALVTGSSRGIGLGLCRGLLERGWMVIATARNSQTADLLDLGRHYPERCVPLNLDLGCEKSMEETARYLKRNGIVVDILIHNAGIFAADERGIHGVQRGAITEVLQTNVIGPLLLTKILLPSLRQPGARVVALTSGKWGVAAPQPAGAQYSYGISKQALWMALHCLRGDMEPLGISVQGICPGFVKTDMTSGSPVEPTLGVRESVDRMLKELIPEGSPRS